MSNLLHRSMTSLPRRPLPALRTAVQRGFTLIELMVVLVIIGVLAALIVPNVLDRADDARVTAARTDITNISQALKLYRLDNQRYQQPVRIAALQRSTTWQTWEEGRPAPTTATRPARPFSSWPPAPSVSRDRKSTRLNSSHQIISYAVFCLKKKIDSCKLL